MLELWLKEQTPVALNSRQLLIWWELPEFYETQSFIITIATACL